MEKDVEAWARGKGFDAEESKRGMNSAVRKASTMEAGKLSFLPIISLNPIDSDQNWHGDGPGGESEAYSACFLLTLALLVLNAALECPRLLFMLMVSEADGACFYNTVCSCFGGDPRKLRNRVLQSLAGDWEKPCHYPGHTGRTHKEALENEFKRKFPRAKDFIKFAWKSNDEGELPESRSVELWRTAELLCKVLCILSRSGNDGELVPVQLVHPKDAHGNPGYLMNGMHGVGGNHYNKLLLAWDGAGEEPELVGRDKKAFESTESLRISETAWNSKALQAKGEALVAIAGLGALHLAENAMGGKEGLLDLVREVLLENAGKLDGLCDEESRRKAAERLADTVSDTAVLVNLFSETASLKDGLEPFLPSDSEPISTTPTAAGGEDKEEEFDAQAKALARAPVMPSVDASAALAIEQRSQVRSSDLPSARVSQNRIDHYFG